MTTTDLLPDADPYSSRLVRSATGLLRDFNTAGLLLPADVHTAVRLGRLGREPDERVLLAVALAVRAVRAGSVCLDLSTVPDLAPDLPWPPVSSWVEAVNASPLMDEGVLRQDGSRIYLERYWREEGQVCADLQARRALAPPHIDEERLGRALDDYFAHRPAPDQRAPSTPPVGTGRPWSPAARAPARRPRSLACSVC